MTRVALVKAKREREAMRMDEKRMMLNLREREKKREWWIEEEKRREERGEWFGVMGEEKKK